MQVAKHLPVLQTTYKPSTVASTLLESVADATEEESRASRIASQVNERNGDPILDKAERWLALVAKYNDGTLDDEDELQVLEREIIQHMEVPSDGESDGLFRLFFGPPTVPIIELLDGRRMMVMCACGKPGVCDPVSFKAI